MITQMEIPDDINIDENFIAHTVGVHYFGDNVLNFHIPVLMTEIPKEDKPKEEKTDSDSMKYCIINDKRCKPTWGTKHVTVNYVKGDIDQGEEWDGRKKHDSRRDQDFVSDNTAFECHFIKGKMSDLIYEISKI